MRNFRYETRLAKLGINRLEDRRVKGDLIEIHKYVNELDEIIWERNPVFNTPKVGVLTISNGVKIRWETFKSKTRNDLTAKQVPSRHNYFSNRITPTWNALTKRIAQAPTLNMFKKGLYDQFNSKGRYGKVHESAKLRCLRTARQKLLINSHNAQ